MIRGDNLYASGIVLVSPLEIEVLEEPGRAAADAAITVRDARTKDFLPKVQVKVIGSDNPQFISGETDLRGVFVAEGVRGVVTAVARKGTQPVRLLPRARLTSVSRRQPQCRRPAAPPGQPAKPARPTLNQSLDANLKMQNSANSMQADRAAAAALRSAGR